MATLQEIMLRAQALRQETAVDSISPERAGSIMYDTLAYINQMQLQGANPLLISKIYASVAAMEADSAPVSDLTGQPLRPGQVVCIASGDPDDPDEGVVYRYDGTESSVSSWTACGRLGSDAYLEGYQYMGVAKLTPAETDPGTPTQKVFYPASEPGTYHNFGDIVVNSGEVAVLKFDGSSWSKEVTGAASAASVTELGQEVSPLFFKNIKDKNILDIEELYLTGLNTSTTYKIHINTYNGAKDIYIYDGSTVVAHGSYSASTFVTFTERNSSGISGYGVVRSQSIVGVLQNKAAELINANVLNINNSPAIAHKILMTTRNIMSGHAQIGINGGIPQIYVEPVSSTACRLHFVVPSVSNMYCDYGFRNISAQSKTIDLTLAQTIVHVLYNYATDKISLVSGINQIDNDQRIVYLGNVITYNNYIFSYNFYGKFIIDGRQIDTRKHEYALGMDVQMSIAERIPVVYGNRLEIFRKSITTEISEIYDLTGETSGGGYSPNTLDRGRFRSNGYYFDATNSRPSFDITFKLEDYRAKNVVASCPVNIVTLAKKTSPSANKNILVIGDSFTWINTWLGEFSRRLTGTGGAPTADGLSNLTFIGTHYDTGKVPSEGYSSQDYAFFTGTSSPFYINGVIDIAQYVADNNYGSIDFAIILLGCNGTNTDASIKALFDALLDYNPSMKILVGSNSMKYNQFGWSNGYGLSAGLRSSNWKNWAEWNNNLRRIISSNYSSNIFYVEIPAQVDIENNFQYQMGNANNRNSSVQIRYGENNVHPADSAYYQIADAFYSAFHFWCL